MLYLENAKDLVEIPKNIKENLEIIPVKWIDEVLEIALEKTAKLRTIKIDSQAKKTNPNKSSSLIVKIIKNPLLTRVSKDWYNLYVQAQLDWT